MPVLSPDQLDAYIVKKQIQNLVIECSSNTQAVIKSGSVAGADDGSVVMEAAGDLTLDITNVGVKNGLDVGPEAADTWYYIWMIWNPTTEEVAGLLSASATVPTLPSGFTKKRLVGAVRNDGSSNLRKFTQYGLEARLDSVVAIYNAFLSHITGRVALDFASVTPTLISDIPRVRFSIQNTGGTPPEASVHWKIGSVAGIASAFDEEVCVKDDHIVTANGTSRETHEVLLAGGYGSVSVYSPTVPDYSFEVTCQVIGYEFEL